MDNWKIRQTIDLARSGQTLRAWPDALMVEGDNEAHTWEITVMENGKPANLDGVTCLVHFLRVREGQDEDVVCKGSIAGNVASVELKAECYVEGQAIGLFRIVVNGRTLTLSKLLFTISKGPTGVVIDPASAVGSLDDLIAKIDAIEAATADGRAQQEQVAQAELSRVSAEQSRVTAEQSRVTAEQERASSESSRASAEQARDTAEQSRAAAEQGRITAEISRASAEQSRVNAEQSRVNAEQERVTAESSRVSAETARTEAEAQRAQTFARFEGEIGSLKNDLVQLEDVLEFKKSPNIFNKDDIDIKDGYYIKASGSIDTNEYTVGVYFVSGKIPVIAGKPYAYNKYNDIGNTSIAYYGENGNAISVISYSTLLAQNGITTAPVGSAYLRITGLISNKETTQVEQSNTITDFTPYGYEKSVIDEIKRDINDVFDYTKEKNNPIVVKKDMFSSGETLSYENAPNIKNVVISFCGNFNSFGSITISHGKSTLFGSSYVIVDNTDVKVYKVTKRAELVTTLQHNLTLSGLVHIRIEQFANLTIRITISCGENTIEFNNIYFNGCTESIKVENENCSCINASLSVYCKEFDCDLWMFGDSYFDQWQVKAYNMGATNNMVDGRAGRGSNDAYTSLVECLKFKTPKKILWCLGMNNKDSDTEVNASWKTNFDKVSYICEEKGIELILTTIPNVPERNHSFKNTIIRESGYRYVDISKLVGADNNTSWYDGLLSNDKVHPTEFGQLYIAYIMINEVPEIMQKIN